MEYIPTFDYMVKKIMAVCLEGGNYVDKFKFVEEKVVKKKKVVAKVVKK
jgi:hypothetical protein